MLYRLVRTMVPWYSSTMVRTYFIPYILETGVRVNKAARDWLDGLTAREQVPTRECPAKTTTRGTHRRGRPLKPS